MAKITVKVEKNAIADATVAMTLTEILPAQAGLVMYEGN